MLDDLISISLPDCAGALPATPESYRVLLVEDDETFCALCTRYLSKAPEASYSIRAAARVDQAMKLCQEQGFDCLVIDYRLPDGTGTEFLSTLQQRMGDATPPAIILTAGGGEKAAIEAVKVNATDFMTKADVSRTSLVRAVDNAIVKYKLRQSVLERNASLERAYGELKKNTDEIKQFYQTVSHEVKTPLMSMQEFLMLLNDEVAGPVSDQQKELLEYALESCDQMAAHFQDLLDVTRMETNKLVLKTSLQSPVKMIRQSVLGMAGEARAKSIVLTDRTSAATPELMLDSHRVLQILGNLLSNAIRFTEPGGEVVLESCLQPENGRYVLTVTDNGPGFDPALTERIFDRLFQVHDGACDEARVGGLGLGLAIARELAQLHGGNVECLSTSPQGSTFSLTLPLP